MSDDTPTMSHDVGALASELRAVHRELREMRGDIRSYQTEAATFRVELAVAQRDIAAAHRRTDELVKALADRAKPWQSVLPSVVVAIVVGVLAFAAGHALQKPSPQRVETHP